MVPVGGLPACGSYLPMTNDCKTFTLGLLVELVDFSYDFRGGLC